MRHTERMLLLTTLGRAATTLTEVPITWHAAPSHVPFAQACAAIVAREKVQLHLRMSKLPAAAAGARATRLFSPSLAARLLCAHMSWARLTSPWIDSVDATQSGVCARAQLPKPLPRPSIGFHSLGAGVTARRGGSDGWGDPRSSSRPCAIAATSLARASRSSFSVPSRSSASRPVSVAARLR